MASLVHNPLYGIQEKLDRAGEHLEALDGEVRTFLHSNPYSFSSEFEPESGYDLIKIHIEELPPLRWGVLLGDFVHNLRSALDHLVWQMVLAMGGTTSDATGFPILSTREDWERRILIPQSRGKQHPLSGIDDRTLEDFEALQPYNTQGKDRRNGLAILRSLSNTDKHQVLNPYFMSLGERPPQIFGIGLDYLEVRVGPLRIEDGTIIGRSHPTHSIDGDVNVEAYFPVEVRFGEVEFAWRDMPQLLKSVQETCKFFLARFRIELPPS